MLAVALALLGAQLHRADVVVRAQVQGAHAGGRTRVDVRVGVGVGVSVGQQLLAGVRGGGGGVLGKKRKRLRRRRRRRLVQVQADGALGAPEEPGPQDPRHGGPHGGGRAAVAAAALRRLGAGVPCR